MLNFHLIYNPYRMHAALYVEEASGWVPVSGASALSRIKKGHLQNWLYADEESGWSGLMEELERASGESTFTVLFTGTEEDLKDLQAAADEFCRSHDADVRIHPYDSDVLPGSAAKLKRAAELTRRAQEDGYFEVFPERLQTLMHAFLQPTQAGVQVIPLDGEDLSGADFILDKNNWDLGIFTFYSASLEDRQVRSRIRAVFDDAQYRHEFQLGQDRLLPVALCEDRQLQNPEETMQRCRNRLISCGIDCRRIYLLEIREEELLFSRIQSGNSESRGLSAAGAKLLEAVMRYHSRFAEQTRLSRQIECFFSLAEEEGFLQGDYAANITIDPATGIVTKKEKQESLEEATGDLYRDLDTWDFASNVSITKSRCITELRRKLYQKFGGRFPAGEEAEDALKLMNQEYAHAADEIREIYRRIYAECIETYCQRAVMPQEEILLWRMPEVALKLFTPEALFFHKTAFAAKAVALFEEKIDAYIQELSGITEGLKEIVEACLRQLGSSPEAHQIHLVAEKQVQQKAFAWLRSFGEQMKHVLDVTYDGKIL